VILDGFVPITPKQPRGRAVAYRKLLFHGLGEDVTVGLVDVSNLPSGAEHGAVGDWFWPIASINLNNEDDSGARLTTAT
jgi:hypothetical protein